MNIELQVEKLYRARGMRCQVLSVSETRFDWLGVYARNFLISRSAFLKLSTQGSNAQCWKIYVTARENRGRKNGGPIEGSSQTPRYHIAVMLEWFQGRPP